MTTRNLTIVVVAALAAVLAWVLLSSDDSKPPAASDPDPRPSVETSDAAGSLATAGHAVARATVGGRVTAAGSGVANAVVILRAHGEDGLPATTRTDAAGAFSFDDVAAGRYAVSATAAGFLPGVVRRLDVGEADPDPVVVELQPGGHRLYGTVRDVTGGPIDGVLVRVVPQSGFAALREYEGFGTLGDDDGRFEVRVPPGRYLVEVSHPDYAPQSRGIEVTGGDNEQNFALVPTASIEGIVLAGAGGPPVAGARVSWAREGILLLPDGQRQAVRAGGGTVTTDDRGRFRVWGLEPGVIALTARAPKQATPEPVEIPVAIAEQVTDVELVLGDAHDVRGRVVDAGTGEAVADARVQLRGEPREGLTVAADADGRFEIHGILPGSYSLFPSANGYAASITGTSVEVDRDIDDVELSLDHGLHIRGRVEPAQLAHVRLDVRPEQMKMGRAMFFVANPDGVETESDGTFELGPVAPGEVTLVATNADGEAGEVAVTVGDDGADGVVVRLQPRARVVGHVRGTDGTPLAQAHVSLRPPQLPGTDVRLTINGRDMGTLGAVTAEDGSFEIVGVGEGAHEVSIVDRYGDAVAIVAGPLDRSGNEPRLEVHGTDRRDVDLTVDAHDGVVEGTVVTAEGEPAADVWVTLTRRPDPIAPEPPDEPQGSRHVARMVIATSGTMGASRPPVLTGEDGRFHFGGLRDGEYEVAAEADGGRSRVTEATRPGREVELALRPLGTVEGTASLDGEPLTAFTVAVAGPTSRRKRVRDDAGAFTVDRLDPGEYTLTVQADGATGRATFTVDAGQTVRRTVTLQQPAKVRGRVVDDAGAPVEGVMILVGEGSAEQGRVAIEQDGSEGMITTDADGKFDFTCAAGARVLVAIEPGEPEPIAVKFFAADAGGKIDLGDLSPADKPKRGTRRRHEDEDVVVP